MNIATVDILRIKKYNDRILFYGYDLLSFTVQIIEQIPSAMSFYAGCDYNTNAPENSMDRAVIKNVLLGKRTSWSNGSPIEFVIPEGGFANEDFLKAFVKKRLPSSPPTGRRWFSRAKTLHRKHFLPKANWLIICPIMPQPWDMFLAQPI